jgi:hypothetical protein
MKEDEKLTRAKYKKHKNMQSPDPASKQSA